MNRQEPARLFATEEGWIEWNQVSEPGAYVTRQGSLVLFFQESLKEGFSPLIKIKSRLDTEVKKIASDPNIEIDDARNLAMFNGLPINF